MRRMTVINGDLILSPESHNAGHENMYIAAQDDRQVHVEHVAYFQSREAFQQPNSAARSYEMMRLRTRKETDGQ